MGRSHNANIRMQGEVVSIVKDGRFRRPMTLYEASTTSDAHWRRSGHCRRAERPAFAQSIKCRAYRGFRALQPSMSQLDKLRIMLG